MRIEINTKPIGVNHAIKHRLIKKFVSKYKTKALKEFENEFRRQFTKYKPEIFELLSGYDERKHGFKLTIFYELPNLFTKSSKTISKTSGDLDGFIKYSVDSLFDCIGINDSQIVELHTLKEYGPKYKIVYNIEIIDFNLSHFTFH